MCRLDSSIIRSSIQNRRPAVPSDIIFFIYNLSKNKFKLSQTSKEVSSSHSVKLEGLLRIETKTHHSNDYVYKPYQTENKAE